MKLNNSMEKNILLQSKEVGGETSLTDKTEMWIKCWNRVK